MLAKIVTKNGETIWYKTDEPMLERHDIALLQFARWEESKLRKDLKTLRQIINKGNVKWH